MKKFIILKLGLSLASLILILLVNGCSPIFSDMQDARTVGKNNVDVTASFSGVSLRDTDEKESAHLQNEFGFQGAYGISDRLDIRLRYAFVSLDKDVGDVNVNVLGIGPKFSLIQDRLSAYVPIGFGFGNDIEDGSNTWQIHPTILGTIPVNTKFDVNPSLKALLPFNDDSETLVAFNIGLGVKLIDNFIIRPEYGMLFNPGEDGHFKQFSIGVTYAPSGYNERD